MEVPKVLTRMRLSCCWGDTLNEEELNEVVDYINILEDRNLTLEKRLGHLLESETIKLYDNVSGKTGEYIRDIRDLDKHSYEKRWNVLNEYVDHRFVAIQFEYENGRIDKFEYVVRENELLKLKERIKNLEEGRDV